MSLPSSPSCASNDEVARLWCQIVKLSSNVRVTQASSPICFWSESETELDILLQSVASDPSTPILSEATIHLPGCTAFFPAASDDDPLAALILRLIQEHSSEPTQHHEHAASFVAWSAQAGFEACQHAETSGHHLTHGVASASFFASAATQTPSARSAHLSSASSSDESVDVVATLVSDPALFQAGKANLLRLRKEAPQLVPARRARLMAESKKHRRKEVYPAIAREWMEATATKTAGEKAVLFREQPKCIQKAITLLCHKMHVPVPK